MDNCPYQTELDILDESIEILMKQQQPKIKPETLKQLIQNIRDGVMALKKRTKINETLDTGLITLGISLLLLRLVMEIKAELV